MIVVRFIRLRPNASAGSEQASRSAFFAVVVVAADHSGLADRLLRKHSLPEHWGKGACGQASLPRLNKLPEFRGKGACGQAPLPRLNKLPEYRGKGACGQASLPRLNKLPEYRGKGAWGLPLRAGAAPLRESFHKYEGAFVSTKRQRRSSSAVPLLLPRLGRDRFAWYNAHETPRSTGEASLPVGRGARGGSALPLKTALHRPATLCASLRSARSLQRRI